jgi:hypothetical protein
MDIVVTFANELGSTSKMTIYGIEFINEGQTMSIADIFTENVVQFVARDLDPMISVSGRRHNSSNNLVGTELGLQQGLRATDLLFKEEYTEAINA